MVPIESASQSNRVIRDLLRQFLLALGPIVIEAAERWQDAHDGHWPTRDELPQMLDEALDRLLAQPTTSNAHRAGLVGKFFEDLNAKKSISTSGRPSSSVRKRRPTAGIVDVPEPARLQRP